MVQTSERISAALFNEWKHGSSTLLAVHTIGHLFWIGTPIIATSSKLYASFIKFIPI